MLRSALSRAMVEEEKRERALQVEQEQAKAVEEAAAQDHAAAAKAAARPRNPNSPFERVHALLRELGESECGDDEDPFEHYLEMMKAELRKETRQLREVNDEDATRLSSPVEINAIMREWSRTSDRRIARRLEAKVTTSLDERLEAVKLEKQQRKMGSAGEQRAMLGSGVAWPWGGGATDNVEHRWRSRPWSSQTSGRAAMVGGGVPRSEAIRRSTPQKDPSGGLAGRPSPGRDAPGRP